MFAPYCPTCASRVLLTTRRIVRFPSDVTGQLDVILRCYCGTEVSAEADPPQSSDARPHQPLPAARPEPVPAAAAAC